MLEVLQQEELKRVEVEREAMLKENMKFAALQLIENMYKKGLLEKHVYRNILRDYGNID